MNFNFERPNVDLDAVDREYAKRSGELAEVNRNLDEEYAKRSGELAEVNRNLDEEYAKRSGETE